MAECETLADLLHNPPEPIKTQEIRNSGAEFLNFCGFSARPKALEIRNSGAEFLICCVFGPAENQENKKFSP